MTKLSIVIITWNGIHHIQKCLQSLNDFYRRSDVEIIIVDNGSHDGTTEWLKERYPKINLVELTENKGVAYARNCGLKLAVGEYILVLDNDTIVTNQAINGMVGYMDDNTDVGLCGCKLIDADGNIQESCKKFPGITEKIANYLYGRHYRYAYGLEKMSKPFEPEYLIGACQLIRYKAFEEVGLLDENIFIGPEDADFCLRLHAKGWKLCYLPQYKILHYCQRITNRHIFSKLGRKHISALFYIYWKYKRLI